MSVFPCLLSIILYGFLILKSYIINDVKLIETGKIVKSVNKEDRRVIMTPHKPLIGSRSNEMPFRIFRYFLY